ncbi:MAG: OmpA family protein [Elusimicrobia bacterium]|nr:OmpA family protein [Elusimicrobiota bacterium]
MPFNSPFDSRKKGGGDDVGLWLMSYADMITLLFAFFVVLASMSTINQAKFEMLSEHFAEVKGKTPLAELQKSIQEMVQQKNLASQVNVSLSPQGVRVQFAEALLFELGKAEIRPHSALVLQAMVDIIKKPPIHDRLVIVEGHTDSVPIETKIYPSNWELSAARASRIIRFFEEMGVDKGRLEAKGYADTRPAATLVKGKPQAENRRVVMIIGDVAPSGVISGEQGTGTGPQGNAGESLQEKTSDAGSLAVPAKIDKLNGGVKAVAAAKPQSAASQETKKSKYMMIQEYYAQGKNYWAQGNHEAALESMNKILKINPEHKLALDLIAKIKGL